MTLITSATINLVDRLLHGRKHVTIQGWRTGFFIIPAENFENQRHGETIRRAVVILCTNDGPNRTHSQFIAVDRSTGDVNQLLIDKLGSWNYAIVIPTTDITDADTTYLAGRLCAIAQDIGVVAIINPLASPDKKEANVTRDAWVNNIITATNIVGINVFNYGTDMNQHIAVPHNGAVIPTEMLGDTVEVDAPVPAPPKAVKPPETIEKPEPKAEVAPKVEPEPVIKNVLEPEPQPEAEPKTVAKPAPEPEAKPEPKAKAKPKVKAKVKTKATATTKASAKIDTKAGTEVVLNHEQYKVHVRGIYHEDETLTILSGNVANESTFPPSFPKRGRTARQDATKNKQLVKDVVKKPIDFSAPTAAAEFAMGRKVNGWLYWKNEEGATLDELFRN